MTAIPSSGSVEIIVNKFDTSLAQGQILVDFTADTIDNNEVVFKVGDLKPNQYYLIKKEGVDYLTKQADSSGYIQFSNSQWSTKTFTIEETSSSTTITPCDTYNIDGIPGIQFEEVVKAISDYIVEDAITKDDAIEVIICYFTK